MVISPSSSVYTTPPTTTVDSNELEQPQRLINMSTANPSTYPDPGPSRPRSPKQKRPVTYASRASSDRRRSTSRDATKRSGHTTTTTAAATATPRRGSPHSPRNARRTVSSSPASGGRQPLGAVSQRRREDLLELHRESCRLFQEGRDLNGNHMNNGFVSDSSVAQHRQLNHSKRNSLVSGHDNGSSRHEDYAPSPTKQPSTPTIRETPQQQQQQNNADPDTVMIDWMTPSTRRREYEKIDRQNRGIRGWWRRIAPKWCTSREKRTPFYEEKDGKANYEGSVRRFRMDLPDDADGGVIGGIRPSWSVGSSTQNQLLPKENGDRTRGDGSGRRWFCFGSR